MKQQKHIERDKEREKQMFPNLITINEVYTFFYES